MPTDYAGPDGTSDFEELDADEAGKKMVAYSMLGRAFEGSSADDMLGRGWLLEESLMLIDLKNEGLAKPQRELEAAVAFVRFQGESEHAISVSMALTV